MIRYTLTDCPLGRLLLAGTTRGICAVYLGDEDTPLETELRREFPAAQLNRADDELRPWTDVLVTHLRGQQPRLDLPLDVQATAFQWRVWQELRRIPAGATKTYLEVAATLGSPTAARGRFTRELSNEQRVRFLARLGARALDLHPSND